MVSLIKYLLDSNETSFITGFLPLTSLTTGSPNDILKEVSVDPITESKVMMKNFTVDARTILHLGRDSIKDHTTALIELIKNSYDADATCVEVEIKINSKRPYIRIADNGCGMTEEDINNHWLRIGFSEKQENKISKRGRRKTGEKGIGRISADRLGSTLELRTKTNKNEPIGLYVNWTDFETGKNLSDIKIAEIEEPQITIPECGPEMLNIQSQPSISGTELIVEGLRQPWTETDINNLYKELSMLVSPFHDTIDFNVLLNTDVVEGYERIVQSELYERYEIRIDVNYDGVSSDITYTLTERHPTEVGQKQQFQRRLALNKLIIRDSDETEVKLGPLDVKLMFYPRIPEIVEGSGFKLGDISTFLNNNAGVKIYRDNIRVKPYGNLDAPEGDWFGLGDLVARDPAGAGRPTFLARPNQLVGAVFISRDHNPELVDSAAREGLVQGAEFTALKEFLIGCVRIVSSRYHERFLEAKSKQQEQPIRRSPSEEVKKLAKELRAVQHKLQSIRVLLPVETSNQVEETAAMIDEVDDQIEDTRQSIEELESQAGIFRGLATIGISSTVFGHEVQTSIDALVGSLSNARKFLEVSPPQLNNVTNYIERAREYANRVDMWGNFALERVRRDKRHRKKKPLDEIVEGIVNELEPAMAAINIDVKTCLEPLTGRVFVMDVEGLLINLLTNAYTACKQKRNNRRIRVELTQREIEGRKGCELIVADSGPGVAEEFREMIWTPLFSTKTTKIGNRQIKIGTGLGLTIVQSILDDLNGTRELDTDPELGGARFKIWFPLQER